MGSLALYGAIAGAGKGLVAGAEQKGKEDLLKLDEARQERLLKMQMTHSETLATTRQEFDTTQEAQRQRAAELLQSQNLAARAGEQAMQDEAAMARTKAQVAGGIEQARISAGARIGAGSKENLLTGKRYESRSLTESEKGQYGISLETDVPAVFDKDTGKIYLQKGNRLEVPGYSPDEYPRLGADAKKAAESALKSMPTEEHVASFEERFGYLPANTFSWMRGYYQKQLDSAK